MNGALTPIETVYNGHKFRSRLEAMRIGKLLLPPPDYVVEAAKAEGLTNPLDVQYKRVGWFDHYAIEAICCRRPLTVARGDALPSAFDLAYDKVTLIRRGPVFIGQCPRCGAILYAING
jgi:hypothetical protein